MSALGREADEVVIGAGPAGLAAAIAFARRGRKVLILEKNDRPGKKLLLTGGGRCNLPDPGMPAGSAVGEFGPPGRFLRQALHAFSLPDFLEGLGVATELDGGLTYVRGGAARMLAALLAEAARLGVGIDLVSAARAARKLPGGGFEVDAGRGTFGARSHLVIAAGGMTWPSTGSSGDGYRLAEGFGLGVEPPRPALGELATRPCFPDHAGIAVSDAVLELRFDDGRRARSRGPLVFSHRGLSGPAVLQLSLDLARAGVAAAVSLVVDLAPGLSREELLAAMFARARAESKRTLNNSGLAEPLPARLTADLARRAGINPVQRVGSLSMEELGSLAGAIKGLALSVRGLAEPQEAIVTVGGVATKDLDPRTMESRLVPGLRFAGEVLAPAGPCGGYNLLMAFATGTAAGG